MNKRIPYLDLYDVTEDARIAAIGRAAMTQIVCFIVENDGQKGDRYLQKLRERCPTVALFARVDGPTAGVETIKVGPAERAPS